LINFKTDLLGLKHNDRYSTETENLVKLIQKYMEKWSKIQAKAKGNKDSNEWRTHRELSSKEYFENDNFIDILEEKEHRYNELTK